MAKAFINFLAGYFQREFFEAVSSPTFSLLNIEHLKLETSERRVVPSFTMSHRRANHLHQKHINVRHTHGARESPHSNPNNLNTHCELDGARER